MRRAAAAALLLAAVAAAPGARAQAVDALLRDLAGGGTTAGVRVEGRLERDDTAAELVVTLSAEGGARLVADPGVQVLPLAGPAGRWAATEVVELVDRGRSYLEGPVELRVPVAEGATGAASAEVAYAWCVVERVCLFGAATVTVPLGAAGG